MGRAGCFLDSGAFSLRTIAERYAKEHGGSLWDYYDTDEFWKYTDSYVKFLRRYGPRFDCYANLDVIGNPELSYRNQKHLEKHGLKPVPVVHSGSDLKWLRKYVGEGHEMIGLGKAFKTRAAENMGWFAECFQEVCPSPSRLPRVKLHGFGIANLQVVRSFPWWSVDSTTWLLHVHSGAIVVPPRVRGEYCYRSRFAQVRVSIGDRADKGRVGKDHFMNLTPRAQRGVRDWLDDIGVALGDDGRPGVMTDKKERGKAVMAYFNRFCDSLPEWPWPYRGEGGFDL